MTIRRPPILRDNAPDLPPSPSDIQHSNSVSIERNSNSNSALAPLTDCPSPQSPEEGNYEVTLAAGRTLFSHKEFVGPRLEPHILRFLSPDEAVYLVAGVDEEVLGRIREDSGVVGVRCDGSGRLEGMVRGDD